MWKWEKRGKGWEREREGKRLYISSLTSVDSYSRFPECGCGLADISVPWKPFSIQSVKSTSKSHTVFHRRTVDRGRDRRFIRRRWRVECHPYPICTVEIYMPLHMSPWHRSLFYLHLIYFLIQTCFVQVSITLSSRPMYLSLWILSFFNYTKLVHLLLVLNVIVFLSYLFLLAIDFEEIIINC